MLDYQKNNILEMDQLAKENTRNILRHGASMLRIQAQGARDYAEHKSQIEAVEEIASTPNASDQESDEKLTDTRFKALVAYETNIEGYLLMLLAALEGWKPSSYQEFDSWQSALGQYYGRAKQLLDTIRSDDIEPILTIVEELTPYTNTTMEILRDIKSKLGKDKYESIRNVAYEKLKDTYV